ncbi:ABC transporter permease [Paenibacillus etheri]|uniref:MacB-like periplasmic core domain-containing protein n=1 Tax=Paenibacillus etheri TaxID=1306852 RepID=A0A0W1B453_9BACL|nr:ABC transporter permease [Paenibacillus etheri]KTD88338.1 hypothetical protein UQ64_06000 [Paenibacillus etheri]
MKKLRVLNIDTLLIVILYTMLSLIVIAFTYYQIKQIELNKLSRSLYNENSIFFTIKDNINEIDWSKIDTPHPYTIFSELGLVKKNESMQEIRAIYFKKNTYFPPLSAGRFFNSQDFNNNKNLAVIGKNIDKTELIEKNEKLYYPYQGKNYEVIGIMGASYSSIIDDTIFVNLDALESDASLKSNIFILNIKNNPITPEGNILFYDSKLAVYMFDRGDSGTVRALNTETQQITLCIAILILLLSSSVIFANYWNQIKKKEILILWYSGIKFKDIFNRFLLSFISITLGCYISVSIASLIFFRSLLLLNVNSFFMYSQGLIIGLLVILVSSVISVGIYFYHTVKQITLKGNAYK